MTSTPAQIKGRITFARSYLADLYEDARKLSTEHAGLVGAWTSASSISDAIDALDRAHAAAPERTPAMSEERQP